MLPDEEGDPVIRDAPRAERLDLHAHRPGLPDRVAQLDLALRGQTGCDDVLRCMARRVRAAAVDPQRVLAAEGRAAVAGVLAIGVDGVLAPGEAGVQRRPAADEHALRIDEDLRCRVGPHRLVPEDRPDHGVEEVPRSRRITALS
jgi:hypothetical protein